MLPTPGFIDAKLAALSETILLSDSDVVRSSEASWMSAQSPVTVGFEIIQFDLLSTPITEEEHLVVLAASCAGIVTGALPLTTFEPNPALVGSLTYARAGVSGFSIVPWGTPTETLAESSAPNRLNFGSRGAQLVTVHGSSGLSGVGGAPWAFVATPSIQQPVPITITRGFNLRYTLCMLPGAAVPGPGPGSYARIDALIVRERNRRTGR